MIFEFWKDLPEKSCVHPKDMDTLNEHKGVFELNVPPGHINGQLKTSPVVALFLNPGFEEEDRDSFENEKLRELLFKQIQGESDFPLWFTRWKKWFLPRVKIGGMTEEQIAINVSILNVCSYASKDAKHLTPAIIEKLPSSQVAINYLHKVLIPQAQRGERFIVVCRAAWAWKIDKLIECENIKFVKNPRGGYFGPEIRKKIETWLKINQSNQA